METPPGFPKQVMRFNGESTIDATTSMIYLTVKEDITPLELRLTPFAVAGTLPTATLSLTDDGSAVAGSQDSTALVAATTRTFTFTQPAHIINGSALVLIVTLGGTTPEFTGWVLELEYMEG